MGIEILPPDVNLSDHRFMVVDGNIRFGLDAVKGVGHAAVEAIKAAREGEGGPFTSLWDFCERVDAPRRQQEGDRGADQVRRVRLDRRDAQGHARGARGRAAGGAEGAAGRADRPELDLRPRLRRRVGGRRRRRRVRPAVAPADPDRRARPQGRCSRWRRSPSACSSPSTRSRRCARRWRAKVDCAVHRRRRPRQRRLGEDRRHGLGGEEDPHALGLDDDVRHHRRPRGQHRGARVREGARRRPRARWPRTTS